MSDTVIQMKEYVPYDITERAKPQQRVPAFPHRCVLSPFHPSSAARRQR
ncbi:MAG: hypothetical protein ACLVG5_00785 [Clostridium sp.]